LESSIGRKTGLTQHGCYELVWAGFRQTPAPPVEATLGAMVQAVQDKSGEPDGQRSESNGGNVLRRGAEEIYRSQNT
ncbi:MAG: hypothetical protein OSA97_07235, partial [Nevskia sp.]|nr:hypothetical protein [Nevskia sp.]